MLNYPEFVHITKNFADWPYSRDVYV